MFSRSVSCLCGGCGCCVFFVLTVPICIFGDSYEDTEEYFCCPNVLLSSLFAEPVTLVLRHVTQLHSQTWQCRRYVVYKQFHRLTLLI